MSLSNYLKQKGLSAVASLRALSFFTSPANSVAAKPCFHTKGGINTEYASRPLEANVMEKSAIESSSPVKQSFYYNDTLSPELLLRLKLMFPDSPSGSHLTSCLLMFKTTNNMAVWSFDSTMERELCTKYFITHAADLCQQLQSLGYWCNFIDPSSGLPYLGEFNAVPFPDCDEDFPQFSPDLELEDIGCCRALRHIDWGFEVFTGVLFSDAPIEIVQNIRRMIN